MGFFADYDSDPLAVLVCDECERVLTREGGLSSKPLGEIPRDDLALHFRPRHALAGPAIAAGWRGRISPVYDHAHWLCPRCATDGGKDSSRWLLVQKAR